MVEFLPPPSLHIIIGLVNKLFIGLAGECKEVAMEWTRSLHIIRDDFHGSHFPGQSCQILLGNVDSLMLLVRTQTKTAIVFKYANALRNLKKVADGCFRRILADDLKESVDKFKSSYIKTGLPITSKAHVTFTHLVEFTGTTKESLLQYTEEAHESIHQEFKKTWSKHSLRDVQHPKY